MKKWKRETGGKAFLKKGEKGLLMNVLTKNNGRYLGWHSKKRVKNINIQPGDIVSLSWNARLSDQLGLFNFEPLNGCLSPFVLITLGSAKSAVSNVVNLE